MLVQDVNRAQESERSLIASVLLDPSTLVLATEVVRPEDFYTEVNRLIFRAMMELDEADKPIDFATITSKLFGNSTFDDAGGTCYLTAITSSLPSAANISHFAEIVRSQSILRQLSHIGDSIKQISGQPVEDIDLLVSQISDDVLNLSMESGTDKWVSFDKAVSDSLKELMNPKEDNLIMTGFSDLDKMMCGLRPGSLTIVAARPAMGKTALGLNIAANAALYQKRSVAFFSLEMTVTELTNRIISSISSVSGNAFRNKSLSQEEWGRVINAAELYSKSKIYIDETPAIDIMTLRDRAKRMQRKHGIELILVDYLQLMTTKSRKAFNREQEVADISRGLKRIAKELHVPVIALAQLNRLLEARQDKRPIMSDLRDSGSIEQDADNIMFIHREGYYKQGGTDDDNIAEIIIAKQRGGPTGTVKLYWHGQFTRFDTLETNFG